MSNTHQINIEEIYTLVDSDHNTGDTTIDLHLGGFPVIVSPVLPGNMRRIFSIGNFTLIVSREKMLSDKDFKKHVNAEPINGYKRINDRIFHHEGHINSNFTFVDGVPSNRFVKPTVSKINLLMKQLNDDERLEINRLTYLLNKELLEGKLQKTENALVFAFRVAPSPAASIYRKIIIELLNDSFDQVTINKTSVVGFIKLKGN